MIPINISPCGALGRSERRRYVCDKRRHPPQEPHHDPAWGDWWGPVRFHKRSPHDDYILHGGTEQ
jgi:hypothetical protein